MRSTLALEAGTPKNFLASGANNGKRLSCAFQNKSVSSYELLAIKLLYLSIQASIVSKASMAKFEGS